MEINTLKKDQIKNKQKQMSQEELAALHDTITICKMMV